jgi:hypothetical protein
MSKSVFFGIFIVVLVIISHVKCYSFFEKNKISFAFGGVQILTTSAYYKSTDTPYIFSSPRISYGINVCNMHYNLPKHQKIVLGLNLKNIGIAERFNKIRYRERMLTIGTNVKHKIKFNSHNSFITEFGFDYNLQFKHQHWNVGYSKDRHVLTDALSQTLVKPFQPFAGIGWQQNHLGVELNYYFNNFYNKQYAGNNLAVMHRFKQANLIVAKLCYNWRL